MKEKTLKLIGFKNEPIHVSSDQVVYLRGDREYSHIHLNDGRVLVSGYDLKRHESLLPQFWRISKGYLVNPDYIKYFNVGGGVSRLNGYIKLKNGMHFDVARRRVGDTFVRVLFSKTR
ncbi:LytTR family DNA-binding domain-containing protein [Larkinella terrae]|uniref:HTH LytTR-type domain-containing protein n=1 Tax=Larkinella terrae TaxID=2025311 RepID=A0A7K0EK14_9BACT|nr:LytTR family DNA-binding domain-containing protein [Larkinella terrae]MRS61788.1 hypothetical protein [Larkinella terrae]